MKASGKIGSNGVQVSDNVEKRFESDIYIHTYVYTYIYIYIYIYIRDVLSVCTARVYKLFSVSCFQIRQVQGSTGPVLSFHIILALPLIPSCRFFKEKFIPNDILKKASVPYHSYKIPPGHLLFSELNSISYGPDDFLADLPQLQSVWLGRCLDHIGRGRQPYAFSNNIHSVIMIFTASITVGVFVTGRRSLMVSAQQAYFVLTGWPLDPDESNQQLNLYLQLHSSQLRDIFSYRYH